MFENIDSVLTNDNNIDVVANSNINIGGNTNQQISGGPEGKSLTLFSYNSTGFSLDRVKFMKDLFSVCNAGIIALQETMILRNNSFKISNAFPDYEHFIVPGKKSSANISTGRPCGGLALMWRKNINFSSSPRRFTELVSDRVQGVKFSLPNQTNLLVVNCYWPNDCLNFDEFELQRALTDVTWLLDNSDCEHVCVLGDLNTHFDRQSIFVGIVREKVSEWGLQVVWDIFDADYSYMHTQLNNDGTLRSNFSLVDHILFSPNSLNAIEQAGVIHTVETSEGHSPIFCKLSCKDLGTTPPPSDNFSSKPDWKKSTQDNILKKLCISSA